MYAVRRILRDHGVQIRGRREALRVNRQARVDEVEIVRRYGSGESRNALAQDAGVSYGFIETVLRDHGVPLRDCGEANRLHEERLTLQERQVRATRHQRVWEGRTYPPSPCAYPEGMRKKAATQQRTKSMQQPTEVSLLGMLPAGWVDAEQLAVDRYNIDLTHGPVAVEVHCSALHPFRSESTASRAVDLAEHGWHVLYFWPNAGVRRITPRGVEELVTHAERLNRDPSSPRQYLVIRGGGELVTAGRFDLEHRALVPAPVDAPEAPDGENAGVAG
ncbi:helix-turn-helix domain-containing protein [Streptomyces koyangensis]|uniref:helix-turn-helix domain-containing protein n=1 Tax=Streptomyces koyangensis TaxID=188770 RepID=UPI003D0435A2